PAPMEHCLTLLDTIFPVEPMVTAMDNAMKKDIEPHVRKFERFERETSLPAWLFPLRKAGMARFAELGFPTLQDEDWRFTNVAPLTKLPFRPLLESAPDGVTPETLDPLIFGKLDAVSLVFVNGHYSQ